MPQQVLVSAPPETRDAESRVVKPWSGGTAVRVAGWLGAVLAAAALSDYALAFYPLGFGSAEWEIATISSVVQGLPLLAIGLAGLWVCGGSSGSRWLLMVVGVALLALAACVLLSLIVFATNIPVALRATQDVARMGIQKLVAKTLILGLLFAASFVVTGVLALRQARGVSSMEGVA